MRGTQQTADAGCPQNAYSAASFRDKRSARPLSSLRNTNAKRQRTNDLSPAYQNVAPANTACSDGITEKMTRNLALERANTVKLASLAFAPRIPNRTAHNLLATVESLHCTRKRCVPRCNNIARNSHQSPNSRSTSDCRASATRQRLRSGLGISVRGDSDVSAGATTPFSCPSPTSADGVTSVSVACVSPAIFPR